MWPWCSNPTGHYKLELLNPYHRIIVQKLVEVAKEQKDFRKNNRANEGGAMIDTSQHGDWENFRNETLNGQKFDFDTDAAATGRVNEGILEFDYVSTDVAHRLLNLPPVVDHVFDLLEIDLHDVKRAVVNRAARKMYAQKDARASLQGSSGRPAKVSGTNQSHDTQSAAPAATGEPTDTPVIVSELAEPAAETELEADPGPETTPLEQLSVSASSENEGSGGVNKEYGEDEEMAALRIQAHYHGRMVRRLHNAKRRAMPILSQWTSGHTELAKASQRARAAVGDVGAVATIEQTIADVVASSRGKKLFHRQRHPWWIANQHQHAIVGSESARRHMVAKRQLLMLRRATIMCYFSCAQLERVLAAVPEDYHVEVIVTLFSRLTDIENLDCARLLKHETFDKDGNGYVMWEELEALKAEDSPDVHTRCGFFAAAVAAAHPWHSILAAAAMQSIRVCLLSRCCVSPFGFDVWL